MEVRWFFMLSFHYYINPNVLATFKLRFPYFAYNKNYSGMTWLLSSPSLKKLKLNYQINEDTSWPNLKFQSLKQRTRVSTFIKDFEFAFPCEFFIVFNQSFRPCWGATLRASQLLKRIPRLTLTIYFWKERVAYGENKSFTGIKKNGPKWGRI